jgi:hypothetical protein
MTNCGGELAQAIYRKVDEWDKIRSTTPPKAKDHIFFVGGQWYRRAYKGCLYAWLGQEWLPQLERVTFNHVMRRHFGIDISEKALARGTIEMAFRRQRPMQIEDGMWSKFDLP